MPNYVIDPNASYNLNIRALENTDPANAETVFNPLVVAILNNVQAVKKITDIKADLNNANFSGTVTAPTQAQSDNSTKVATTAYVTAKVGTTGADISLLSAKVDLLETMLNGEVTNNLATVTFNDLNGINITKGVYNITKLRIEC